MIQTLRAMATPGACLLALLGAPLQALALSQPPATHGSPSLAASLAAVLGLVALASAGARALAWYGARQRLQRRQALMADDKLAPRLVLMPGAPVANMPLVTAAADAAATAASAASASGRRAQAVRSRRPGLAVLRRFTQPSQVASQFGHLN